MAHSRRIIQSGVALCKKNIKSDGNGVQDSLCAVKGIRYRYIKMHDSKYDDYRIFIADRNMPFATIVININKPDEVVILREHFILL